MRGKLGLDPVPPVEIWRFWEPAAAGGQPFHRQEVSVSRARRFAAMIVGLVTVVVASSAQPQGNIDAGKTPAQMFSDTCSTCHRRPQELRRGASAGFLRQHYMTGSQEAAAMASYLAGIPSDPRAAKDRKDRDKDKGKAQQQAQDKAKAPPPTKGRRTAEAPKAAAEPVAEEPPPQETAEVAVPKLEPFLE